MNADVRSLQWRTSSYSATNAECVEVAPFDCAITVVRDSKDPGRGYISVPPGAWRALLDATVSG
ncbi:DUF397 domain-containing protein [Embleya sp. MST-111070]|uniref:DUF397 domain-containing protein n=1 Tax=Embleya sp. MST-111070 TaxID=3398231 RepID=UPI003F73A4D0